MKGLLNKLSGYGQCNKEENENDTNNCPINTSLFDSDSPSEHDVHTNMTDINNNLRVINYKADDSDTIFDGLECADICVSIKYSTKEYIDFLNGLMLTENNKTYLNIAAYTDYDLECDHRYIQWIFPTTTPSGCASNVPVIDIAELEFCIKKDRTIIDKLLASYNMMMRHWGLDGIQYPEKIELLNGHDALRFSRMLQSLVYHGKKDWAMLAYEIISQHIGYDNSILSPMMYYGPNLESMVQIGYLHNIKNDKLEDINHKFKCKCKMMDAWKYHLLKAIAEYDNYTNNKINDGMSF